ncbi:MAG: site-specific integrase [Thermoplasmata archaeon]|nr:site-specific integrase [Thermoplasmata archaeon]
MTRGGIDEVRHNDNVAGAHAHNKRTDIYGNAYDQRSGNWGRYDDAAKEEQGILCSWLTKKRCEVELNHGLRIAEVCHLMLDDIDFKHGIAYFNGKGPGEGKPRYFTFKHETEEIIKRWIPVRESYVKAVKLYDRLGKIRETCCCISSTKTSLRSARIRKRDTASTVPSSTSSGMDWGYISPTTPSDAHTAVPSIMQG